MTKTAAYLRISREDGDKSESNSIANQRSLIRDFIKKRHDMVLVEEFSDDGYSGTSFERPAFKRLVEAAKNKEIDCIIVKDLSRLGRNYIESGRYLERTFPMLGVRFISVLDNYDSAEDNESGQLLMSFKNIINDTYCRDISLKIRSSLDSKRKNGDFIGSFAPYGYKKDSQNHNHLIIDDYTADVVRKIFSFKIAGHNAKSIAAKLDDSGILPPMEYKRMCSQNSGEISAYTPAAKWSSTAVIRILKNEVYTGTMVQNKIKKISYKIKKCRPVAESEHIRVENTHEAIIPKPLFDTVQRLLAMDTRTSPKNDKLYLFSGIMKCADCGENMIRRNSYRNRCGQMMHSYICSTYVHEHACTSHNILEKLIEPAVKTAIREQFALLSEAEQVLTQVKCRSENNICIKIYDKQITAAAAEELRYNELKIRLYKDMLDEIVTFEEYRDMTSRFSRKAEAARKKKTELQKTRDSLIENSGFPAEWTENFKKADRMEKLDRNMLVTLIEKIIIHDDKRIEIVFRHAEEMAEYIAFAKECRLELVG